MIPFEEAYNLVINQLSDFGTESVSIKEAFGRVLAEEIIADRHFPPFNRSTKDGIAINYAAIEKGETTFNIAGTLAAGVPTISLENSTNCIEIMTGAMVPDDADTVVMYEDISIKDGQASLHKIPKKGANIHGIGTDISKGEVVLDKNTTISPAVIGVMASVGKERVHVKKLPAISVISTGKELVEIKESPLPYQIRRSNAYTLYAALSKDNILPLLLHLDDDKDIIRQKLQYAIQEMDVLLLSGGVSKGKFDFIPEILDELGTEKIFHKVRQRPGKPFWFGYHKQANTVIFSFPGNPVSTYVNYHVYFKPWLQKVLLGEVQDNQVILGEEIDYQTNLTGFLGVKIKMEAGCNIARRIIGNGSGDLINLSKIDGFIKLDPLKKYKKGAVVPFISTTSYY